MKVKNTIIFFSLFIIIVFSFFYINARIEYRKEYHFVIYRYDEKAKGIINFSNNDNGFLLSKYELHVKDIEKEDSLVKKAFSEKVYIYKKNKKTGKYFLAFVVKHPGMFPIGCL